MDAVRALRDLMSARFGSRFVGWTLHRSIHKEAEIIDLRILRVQIRDASDDERASAWEQMIDYLADHPDLEIRRDISIEVC